MISSLKHGEYEWFCLLQLFADDFPAPNRFGDEKINNLIEDFVLFLKLKGNIDHFLFQIIAFAYIQDQYGLKRASVFMKTS